MKVIIFIAAIGLCIWLVSRKKNSKDGRFYPTQSNSNENNPIKYDNVDDWKADLKTLWTGAPLDIEFTYESRKGKKRRKISLTQVSENSRHELYLIGNCYEKHAQRTFNIENVTTMILYKSKRFHHYDFLNDIVGIDPSGYAFSN